MIKTLKVTALIMLGSSMLFAQTNPVAQSLPYNEDFSSLAHSSTTYPNGWQGWNVASGPGASFRVNSPTGDRALIANSTAGINSGNVHNYDGKIGFLNNSSLDLSLALALNTTGFSNINISYDIMTIRNPYDNGSNTRINQVTLQYRIGTSGDFTTLTGIEYENNTTTLTTSGSTTPQKPESKSIQLPAACNNQPVVQLRWISRQLSGSGARPSFALDNISIGNTGSGGSSLSVAATADATEGTSPVNGNFTFTFAPATTTATTFDYTLSGTAGFNTDYNMTLSAGATPSPVTTTTGTITVPSGVSSFTATVSPINDNLVEGTETVMMTISAASGSYVITNGNATVNIIDDEATRIHSIQGTGNAATPGNYTVEAIVTGIYPTLSPAGFYIQEEDADADSDPNSSEGIFVVSAASVAVGDLVRVGGTVIENGSSPSFNQAVINNTTVSVLSSNNPLPTPATIALPVSDLSDYEHYEGMLVHFPDTLTVTDIYNLGRYGEINLSKGGMVYQPTQLEDPNDAIASGTNTTGASNVAAVNALALSNSLRTILMDDGRGTIPTLPFVNGDNTLRLESTLNGVTGILGYAFSAYRIQPIPSAPPVFNYAPRPAVPSVGSNANVKVASFNVLNYFNGNGTGSGFPTSRGAHSLAEFNRQREKIINAIADINADVVGLIEMENDGTGANSALQDLVNGLNAKMGSGTYNFINDGATIQTFGTDEIRCAIIYKPAVVSPVGAVMISSDPVFNRPPVAQTFKALASCSEFNYIINHFKSKGCSGSTGADTDQMDGQSCYNLTRKLQATALTDFINNTVITTSGTDKVISMGDYNAYFEEDPMDVFRASGLQVLGSGSSYSYLYFGQVGSLDHSVVSGSLASQVTGIAKWNINAAEPPYLDYNDDINDGGGDAVNPWSSTYSTIPFRSSDHDPVLVGLDLQAAPLAVNISVTPANNTYTGGIPTNIYLGYGPQSATLNATATGAVAFTYSWSPATGLSCSNCQNPVFTPSAAGSYPFMVTATSNSGCSVSNAVAFCVKDVQAGKNKVYVCHNGNAIAVNASAVPAHLNNHNGDRLGDCGEACGISTGVEAMAHNELQELKIYPNPNTGKFNIELPAGMKEGQASVIDMSGRVISQMNFQSASTITFSLDDVAEGVYMVEVVHDNTAYRALVSVKQ